MGSRAGRPAGKKKGEGDEDDSFGGFFVPPFLLLLPPPLLLLPTSSLPAAATTPCPAAHLAGWGISLRGNAVGVAQSCGRRYLADSFSRIQVTPESGRTSCAGHAPGRLCTSRVRCTAPACTGSRWGAGMSEHEGKASPLQARGRAGLPRTTFAPTALKITRAAAFTTGSESVMRLAADVGASSTGTTRRVFSARDCEREGVRRGKRVMPASWGSERSSTREIRGVRRFDAAGGCGWTHEAVREVGGEVAVGADAQEDEVEDRKAGGRELESLRLRGARRACSGDRSSRRRVCRCDGGCAPHRAGFDLVLVRHRLGDGWEIALDPVDLSTAEGGGRRKR